MRLKIKELIAKKVTRANIAKIVGISRQGLNDYLKWKGLVPA